MHLSSKVKYAVAGGLAGIANGFFGGGGGMVLVPLLTRWIGLEERQAFATSVAVILPLCAVSAVVYLFRAEINLMEVLPYLLGGLVGGFVGGRIFKKVPTNWLRRIFGVLILYAGIKSLL